MLIKGIGVVLLILMVASVKASYNARAMMFIFVVGAMLYVGLRRGRR